MYVNSAACGTTEERYANHGKSVDQDDVLALLYSAVLRDGDAITRS